MNPEDEAQQEPTAAAPQAPALPSLVAPEGPRVYRVQASTGEILEMRAGPELEAGLRSGQLAISSEAGTVGLVDDQGNAYDVDVANLGTALADPRFRLETAEEAIRTEAQREAEENPTLSAARAFAGSAADQLSFGALSASLTPEGRIAQGVDVEASPIASTLGTIGGIVAPALLTGGGSLAGSGLRGAAALTPGGAAAFAGGALERAILARFGQSAGTRALATVSGAVADGALSGAASAITTANIQGTPLEAEQILSDTLFGAALGLGGGALIAGGVATGRRVGQALRGASGTRAADYARRLVERGLGELPAPVASRAQRIAAWASGVDANDLAIIARDPARAFDSAGFATATRETADALGSLRSQLDEATAALSDTATRRSSLASAIGDVDAATARATASAALEATQGRLRQALEQLGGDGRTAAARVLRGLSDDVGGALRNVGGARVLDDLSLDGAVVGAQLAGQTGEAAAQAARAASATTAIGELDRIVGAIDDAARASSDDATRAVLAELRTTLANTAGDAATFGQAGARFGELESARQGLAEARRILDVDARTLADAATTPGGAQELTRAIEDAEGLLARAEAVGANVAPARAALEQARERVAAALDWGDLRGAAERGLAAEGGHSVRGAILGAVGKRAAASVVGGAIGAMLGGESGALAGAAAGGLLGHAMHPVSAYQRLARLSTSIPSFAGRLEAGIARLDQAISSGALLTSGASASAVRTSSQVVIGLRGKPEERRREYRHVSEEIRALASDPDALGARLGETITPVGEASPELADAMTSTAVRGVAYLAEHLPAVDQPTLFQGQLEPSQFEVDGFLRRYEAVEDPLSILDRAAEGSLRIEHREAVQAVYPEIYSEMQARISELIGQQEQRPPYPVRLQLGLLMGVPADRSLTPEMIVALQSNYAQTAPQFEQVHGPTQARPERLDSSTSEASLPRSEEIARRL